MGHTAAVREEVRFFEKLHRAHVAHVFEVENSRVVFVKHVEENIIFPEKAGNFRDGSGCSVPERELANTTDPRVQRVLVCVEAARVGEN